MKVKKTRDLTLVEISREETMVIACDSCGGIGSKAGDALRVPAYYTGRYTVRVGLMEVISAGAEVVTVTDAVCNEMEPTGREIIRGIRDELKAAEISDVVLTGSTEENFPTVSTAVGITVIGIVKNSGLRVGKAREGAVIVSVGMPKIGDEIRLDGDPDIVGYAGLRFLLEREGVLEIIPVGSKGILYEAGLAAENSGMTLSLEKNIAVDIRKSAGPATCAIAIVSSNALDDVMRGLKNVNIIGSLTR